MNFNDIYLVCCGCGKEHPITQMIFGTGLVYGFVYLHLLRRPCTCEDNSKRYPNYEVGFGPIWQFEEKAKLTKNLDKLLGGQQAITIYSCTPNLQVDFIHCFQYESAEVIIDALNSFYHDRKLGMGLTKPES